MMDSDVFIKPRLDNRNSVSLHLQLMPALAVETLSAEAVIGKLLCSGGRASSDKQSWSSAAEHLPGARVEAEWCEHPIA